MKWSVSVKVEALAEDNESLVEIVYNIKEIAAKIGLYLSKWEIVPREK